MKKVAAIIISLLFSYTISWAAYDGHVYEHGKVDAVKGRKITVSGRTYDISPKCKIIIQYKKDNAFYEKEGRLSDLHQGQDVYVKVIRGLAFEIVVEGWKQ